MAVEDSDKEDTEEEYEEAEFDYREELLCVFGPWLWIKEERKEKGREKMKYELRRRHTD